MFEWRRESEPIVYIAPYGRSSSSSVGESICRPNSDLRASVDGDVRRTKAVVDPSWTEGHPKAFDVAAGRACLRRALGNILADAAAGGAAELAYSHNPAGPEAYKWEAISYLVALRLATLEAQAWAEGNKLVPGLEPLPEAPAHSVAANYSDLRTRIKKAGHVLCFHPHYMWCTVCRRRTTTSWRRWLVPCPAGAAAADLRLGRHKPPRNSSDLVPNSRRQKLARRQRVEIKKRCHENCEKDDSAWSLIRLNATRADHLALGQSPSPPPQPIHDSHYTVQCGGLVGCFRCALIGDTISAKFCRTFAARRSARVLSLRSAAWPVAVSITSTVKPR